MRVLSSLLCLTTMFLLCGYPEAEETPVIAVSIPPIQEWVEASVSGNASVLSICDEGDDVHDYSLSEADREYLKKADFFFVTGADLDAEKKAVGYYQRYNQKGRIFDLSQGVDLMESHFMGDISEIDKLLNMPDIRKSGKLDPHIWLSLRNAGIMIRNLRDCLINVMPKQKDDIYKRSEVYIRRLNRLHANVANELYRLKGTYFVSMHYSWGYFARDYELVELAMPETRDIRIETLEKILKTADAFGVKVVIASPQTSPKDAGAVAERVGAVVRLVDPLKKGYLENMAYVASMLKHAGSDEKYR